MSPRIVPLPDLLRLQRQQRTVRAALLGAVKWIQARIPMNPVDFKIDYENMKYMVHITVEMLEPDLQEHMDKQKIVELAKGNPTLYGAEAIVAQTVS